MHRVGKFESLIINPEGKSTTGQRVAALLDPCLARGHELLRTAFVDEFIGPDAQRAAG